MASTAVLASPDDQTWLLLSLELPRVGMSESRAEAAALPDEPDVSSEVVRPDSLAVWLR